MRFLVCLLVLLPSVAVADEPDDGEITIRASRLDAPMEDEPLLHLDAIAPLAARAEGGLLDGQRVALDLGPAMRLAAEGTWWQTGLAPSMFATDLAYNGWRAAGELSYDLGPFRVGMNASLGRHGDTSHRMVGLFAYRTFRLSRWMHAWIVLGIGLEQWDHAGVRRQGTTTGIAIGTTFR